MNNSEIKAMAIKQLSDETNIADYFIVSEINDKYVSRCILIAKNDMAIELNKTNKD